jgi:hypothetical protein
VVTEIDKDKEMHPGLSTSDASLQNIKQLDYVSPKRPQIKS